MILRGNHDTVILNQKDPFSQFLPGRDRYDRILAWLSILDRIAEQEPLRNVVLYTQMLQRRYSDALDVKGREACRSSVEGAQRVRKYSLPTADSASAVGCK